MTTTPNISRPALRYFGGKWKLAPWIISHFPAHRTYTEVFGGGASVLLRKPRAYAEIYNDLDSEIVNVFRVLRDPDHAAELCRRAALMPFSRQEFEEALQPVPRDLVDQALRVLFLSAAGFSNIGWHHAEPTGFRGDVNRSYTTPAMDWASWPALVGSFTERLRGVIIENDEAGEVLRRYDGPASVHYIDPPYVLSERNHRHKYNHDFEDADHKKLVEILNSLEGSVIVSGYRCDMYDEMFSDWTRRDRRTYANGANPRIESVWLNPRAARHTPNQTLFDEVG